MRGLLLSARLGQEGPPAEGPLSIVSLWLVISENSIRPQIIVRSRIAKIDHGRMSRTGMVMGGKIGRCDGPRPGDLLGIGRPASRSPSMMPECGVVSEASFE